MEELNKNQIVLLVLLVSFVTSIATGIVTVTLLDQAPPAVTQTINRIVERTVEKVVPRETQVSTVIREVPVIVTEEDLIVKATNQGAKAMVRLVEATDETKYVGSAFLAAEGRIITSSKIFAEGTTVIPALKAILDDGRKFDLEPILPESLTKPSLNLKIKGELPKDLPSLTLSSSTISIGQTVISLGAADKTGLNVAVGIISSFLSSGSDTSPYIVTNASSKDNHGGPVLNIKGEVIGLNHGASLALPVDSFSS
ncbi:MAG: trypsin-like peptidase domain-containing protein [Patescibacteria group bacterium]